MAGFCRKCGSPLGEDAMFCKKCGTQVVSIQKIQPAQKQVQPPNIQCRKCGNALNDGAMFCKKCGTRVGMNQSDTSKMQPEVLKHRPNIPLNNENNLVTPVRRNRQLYIWISLGMAFVLFFTVIFTGFVYPRWIPRGHLDQNPKIGIDIPVSSEKKYNEIDQDENINSKTWNGESYTPDESEGALQDTATYKFEPELTDTSDFKPVMLTGNSVPFDIEPVEGFHVRGDKDVLDQDREIKITELSDEDFDSLESKIHEQISGSSELFYAFDIDMGLQADEQLPGQYEIALDLNQLGLEEEIQQACSIVRYSDNWDRVEELHTELKDGELIAHCSQNSKYGVVCNMLKLICTFKLESLGFGLATGIIGGITLLVLPLVIYGTVFHYKQYNYFVSNRRKDSYEIKELGKPYSLLYCWDDVAMEGETNGQEINDSNKNYRVWYDEYSKQVEKVYNEACEEYEKAIRSQVKDNNARTTVLQKLIERLHQRRKAVQALDKVQFIQEYAKKDNYLNKLKSEFKLPQAIQIIMNDLDTTFSYISEQKIKRPNYVLQYQLLPRSEFDNNLNNYGSKKAENTHRAYLQLNVDSLFVDGEKSKGIDESKTDGMLLTCTHETLHACQAEYVKNKYIVDLSDVMGIEFGIGNLGRQYTGNPKLEEAMAGVFEYDAASDYYRRGIIKTPPTHNEGSSGFKTLGLVSRADTQYHALPFRADIDKSRSTMEGETAWYKTIGETELSVKAGYAFSNLIDYLRENQYQASMSEILNAYYKSGNKNVETLMQAFKIDSTERFDELWKGYCKEYASHIVKGSLTSANELKAMFPLTFKNLELRQTMNEEKPYETVTVARDNYTDTVFTVLGKKVKLKEGKMGDRNKDSKRFSVAAYPNEAAMHDKYVDLYFLDKESTPTLDGNSLKYIVQQNRYLPPKNNNLDTNEKYYAIVETNEKANDSAEDSKYQIVAYYEPDQPDIKVEEVKNSNDKVTDANLVVNIPEPAKKLVDIEKISGIRTVFKNKITGNEYNVETKIGSKDIGGKIRVDLRQFGISWDDRTKPVDLEVYQYWYHVTPFYEVYSPNSVPAKLQRDKEDLPEETEETEKPEETHESKGPEKPAEPNGSSNDEETGQFLMWPCRAPLERVKDIHKEVYTSPIAIECDSGSVTFTLPGYSRDTDNGSPVHEEWSPYTITINNIKKSESMYQGGGYIWSANGLENIRISPIVHTIKGTMVDRETKEKKPYTQTTTYSMPASLDTGRKWDFTCELLRSEHGNWYVAYVELYVDVERKDTSNGSESRSKDYIRFKFTSNEKEARYEDALSHKNGSTGSVDFEW